MMSIIYMMDNIESFLLANYMKLVDASQLYPEEAMKLLKSLRNKPHVFGLINLSTATRELKDLFVSKGIDANLVIMVWRSKVMIAYPHDITRVYLSKWVKNENIYKRKLFGTY